MERIRAKVINMANPGEYITINFNGQRYGYQADEEYDMPKFIFDYLNSIEKTRWVQEKGDRAPRPLKSRMFMAVEISRPDDSAKKKVIKEMLKEESKEKQLAAALGE